MAVDADKVHGRLVVNIQGLFSEGGTELGDAGAEPPLGVTGVDPRAGLAYTSTRENVPWLRSARMAVDADEVNRCLGIDVLGSICKCGA
jgi:hypothetical protein